MCVRIFRMDTVDFVIQSKEMESLRNLCKNLNIDFCMILKSKDGISTTVGTMTRRDSEEIIAENAPTEAPVIILPNLPFCYEDLFSAELQYEMVKFVLTLIQLYIGKSGILGEGINRMFLLFSILFCAFRTVFCLAFDDSSLNTSCKAEQRGWKMCHNRIISLRGPDQVQRSEGPQEFHD